MQILNTAERFWLASLAAAVEAANEAYKDGFSRILLDRGEDLNKNWIFNKDENGGVISYNEKKTVVDDADEGGAGSSSNRENSS